MGNAPRVGTPIDEQSPSQIQASESLQQGEEVVLRSIRHKRPKISLDNVVYLLGEDIGKKMTLIHFHKPWLVKTLIIGFKL